MKSLRSFERIILAIGLFIAGFSVGVIADISESVINDSLVKQSVYGDAILLGIARQDTDGRVFWLTPDGKEVAARFDP